MGVILIECSPERVVIDTSQEVADSDRFIYEDLKYYCSKFDSLPAVMLAFVKGSFVLRKGLKYLKIARELQRKTIRAVVEPVSEEELGLLLAVSSVRELDWSEMQSSEQKPGFKPAWHVFFFESTLTSRAKQSFRELVNTCFESKHCRLLKPVEFVGSGEIAEFEALTPHGNHEWAQDYLARLTRYSKQEAAIRSYQGRRFLVGEASQRA